MERPALIGLSRDITAHKATLLGRSLRAGDLACRYGGEELALILHGSTLEDAQLRLDVLRRVIRQTRMVYRGGELPAITVSIGVVMAVEAGETDAATLLNRADTALHQAKVQGRNRVVAVFSESGSDQPTGNSSEKLRIAGNSPGRRGGSPESGCNTATRWAMP